MAIHDIVARLYRAGITLIPADGDRIEAAGPLTDELRGLIRTHKRELRAELVRQQIGERTEYPSPVPRTYVVPDDCPAREACHRLGPCGPPATYATCHNSLAPPEYQQRGNDHDHTIDPNR